MEALTIFDLKIGKTYTFARLVGNKKIKRSTFESILYYLYSEDYKQDFYCFDNFICLLDKENLKLKLDNFSFTVINKRKIIDIDIELKKQVNTYAYYQKELELFKVSYVFFKNYYLFDVIVKVDKYIIPQTFVIKKSIPLNLYKININLLLEIIAKLKNQRLSAAAFAIYDYIIQNYKELDLNEPEIESEKIFIEI